MTFLVPEADGIAEQCRRRLPQATVLACEHAGRGELGGVTFYCLPYMGAAASIALMATMPALAVVQSQSSGVDELLPVLPDGVTLCNGRGLGHEEGTADLAVTLILASLRQVPRFAAQQAERTWLHHRTEALAGKRVLLVGYGAIGAAIEQRLSPFGVVISRVSRTAREGVRPLGQLRALAAEADILVACIALSSQTAGLVSAEVLAALPDNALVVNVARGTVIDAAALTAQLSSRRLRAALDVTDPEPLPADRVEWSLPNVLITPHIGGDTSRFGSDVGSFVADQAVRHLAGQPLSNVVRPGRQAGATSPAMM